MEHQANPSEKGKNLPDVQGREGFVEALCSLPPAEIADRVAEAKEPGEIVRHISCEDFYWLAKRTAGEGSLPSLLRYASTEQWQYLLDLAVWKRDRFDLSNAVDWLKTLYQADPHRLAAWMLGDGDYLACLFLSRTIEVFVRDAQVEDFQPPAGSFTVDDTIFVRALDSRMRDTLESMIRTMADEDFERYQALLLSLADVLPAEVEEEMYRLRSVRLAEHGFLPFDEALEVYAPLEPDALDLDRDRKVLDIFFHREGQEAAPLMPLRHAGGETMLMEALQKASDPAFLNRIRLEFACLSNQILSADGLPEPELETLVETGQKAAGYLNMALEGLAGKDLLLAQEILANHPLVSLFRVGYGFVLALRWEAERWVKASWFRAEGLGLDFWGEPWAGVLKGLLRKRPKAYAGVAAGGEYRDFRSLAEVEEGRRILQRVRVLDGLISRLTGLFRLGRERPQAGHATFHTMLFNFWARRTLEIDPGFSGIPLDLAKALFKRLRGGRKRPPFRMTSRRQAFVSCFLEHVSDFDPESIRALEDALRHLWKAFQEEYEWVPLEDLDARFSRYLTIS